jgi:hypothetical protein
VGVKLISLTEEHKLRAIGRELPKNVFGPTKIRRTACYSIVKAITLTGINRRNVCHAFQFLELHTNFR